MASEAPPQAPTDPTVIPTEQRQKIIDTINARAPGGGKCPVCAPGQFGIADHYVTNTILSPEGGIVLGGTTYPSIMLICGHCGFVRLHNAIVLGAIPGNAG